MTHERLINSLACALLGVEPRKCDPSGAWATRDLVGPAFDKSSSSNNKAWTGVAGGKGGGGGVQGQSRVYRDAILAALKGSECTVRAAAALCIISFSPLFH